MSKTHLLETMREIMRAFRHLKRYEPPQVQEQPLSRREASRRFKEKLVRRYGTPNRCC